MDQKYLRIMILPLLLVCLIGISGAEPNSKTSGNAAVMDYTEGGHYDTDFNASFMSEWWYQNGDMRLVGEDGEKRKLAFFVVMVHQESPTAFYDSSSGTKLSNMATFYGLYPDGETTLDNYTMCFVPRENIENYVGFHVPYLDFTYPEGLRSFYGSALKGYQLDYNYDNMQLNLLFKPLAEKTIDIATDPVNFTTYEYAYGKLKGSVVLDGKKYTVTQADGYFDHMIPYTTDQPVWEMEMHGWSWSELTTDSYQTVFYGVRGPDDGYDYTYKHLTLIDKHTGKVLPEPFSGIIFWDFFGIIAFYFHCFFPSFPYFVFTHRTLIISLTSSIFLILASSFIISNSLKDSRATFAAIEASFRYLFPALLIIV